MTNEGDPRERTTRQRGDRPVPPPDLPAAQDAMQPVHPRYEVRDFLGGGGQGVVYRVFDADLQRDVALKTLRPARCSPEAAESFVDEAQAAACLEHPNIVPIHDVGRLADGRPYFTMRLIHGQPLSQVIARLAAGELSETEALAWSTTRLVQVVQQASRALQSAHERGVIHRDVKPANIMLGDHGEVLLVDWGIAKSQRASGRETESGVFFGTPSYVAPEQVLGQGADQRADVYSLGVVLYECLTLGTPFPGAGSGQVLAAVLRDAPLPPEQVAPAGRLVPPELSALALRALEKDPEQRLPSARAFDAELQAFLEGVRDRERRLAEAGEYQATARAALARHRALRGKAEAARSRLGQLEEEHPPWQPVEEKRELFAARRRGAALDDAARAALLDAINGYTDALAHLPDHAGVRSELADLYWELFLAAEARGDRAQAQAHRRFVERYHDGRLDEALRGDGRLELAVQPEHAELTLHPLVEEDLVIVDGEPRPLGSGAAAGLVLPMGSYVLVARADGFEPARYPVFIGRSETWSGHLDLLPTGSIPAGFVHVPAFEAWVGGDPEAQNSWPRQRIAVESFLLGRHHVTFAEYCAFLDTLEPAEADRLAPRVETVGALAERSTTDGRWQPKFGPLLGQWFLQRFGLERVKDVPVLGVDRECAESYARWLGARLGRTGRLPTTQEWEAVARGADGRVYPWGDRFDAALCHVRDSIRGTPDVAPVGSVATDVSVHGVHDLAGTLQEWTGSWFAQARDLAEVRGGGWTVSPVTCRSAYRGAAAPITRSVHLGFRCVLELSSGRY